MSDPESEIPNTTLTQRALAIGGATLIVGGDAVQGLGSLIESTSEGLCCTNPLVGFTV